MIVRALILFTLIAQNVYAVENLNKTDYVGKWPSYDTVVEGEKQSLIINSDYSTQFIREFNDGNNHNYTSKPEDFVLLDDIILLNYFNDNNQLAYKLVLSGWKTERTKALYGIMFMYSNGTQFNGIPIAFRIVFENE